MIELDVDMEYCLDADMLGYIILHDENGEMDDMVFVPERTCRIIWNETDKTWECNSCGGAVGLKEVYFCESCGAKVVE